MNRLTSLPFVFRVVAIALASLLLKWWVVKLLGGAYLIYVALKHFFFEDKHDAHDAQAHDPLIGAAPPAEPRATAAAEGPAPAVPVLIPRGPAARCRRPGGHGPARARACACGAAAAGRG